MALEVFGATGVSDGSVAAVVRWPPTTISTEGFAMAGMRRAPLERDHPYKSGQELQSAFAVEMEQKIAHQNIHVSLPPAALEALRTESKIAGIYGSDAAREAVVDWIAARIDQRNELPRNINDSAHG